MKRRISHTIEIDAAPAEVWAILTDTASFPTWNPFIRKLEGELRVGAQLLVVIQPPGRSSSTFRPTVLAAEAPCELRWLGRMAIPGIFAGEHSFSLEPSANGGTRLTQAERFAGLLVRPFKSTLDSTELGFQQMNEALKQRIEGAEPSDPADGQRATQ